MLKRFTVAPCMLKLPAQGEPPANAEISEISATGTNMSHSLSRAGHLTSAALMLAAWFASHFFWTSLS